MINNKVRGFFKKITSEVFTQKKETKENPFLIQENDEPDVIFAKNLNKDGGRFFYCENIGKLQITLKKLIKHLKIEKIYCAETNIQENLNKLNIFFDNTNPENCEAILTTCEYIIANQGKVLLSSKQMGKHNLKDLPNQFIVLSYTSQIALRINDAMRGMTNKYKTQIPSHITSVGNQKNGKKLNVLVFEDFKSFR
tara:strand:+ start:72 stop:659 length:588 start_codon:yes stop_codon:yes gene_type:complete